MNQEELAKYRTPWQNKTAASAGKWSGSEGCLGSKQKPERPLIRRTPRCSPLSAETTLSVLRRSKLSGLSKKVPCDYCNSHRARKERKG